MYICFVLTYRIRFSKKEIERYVKIHNAKEEEYYGRVLSESIRPCLSKDIIGEISEEDGIAAGETLWKRWYEKAESPIDREAPSWNRRTPNELWRLFNPPQSILQDMETSELAELIIRHPLLGEYGELSLLCADMKRHSNVF
ncbi:MAG: hypothetical protein K5678_09445 [Acetatifactor sp.]|nr:hypothetical protein [Acetatifactor sp.]